MKYTPLIILSRKVLERNLKCDTLHIFLLTGSDRTDLEYQRWVEESLFHQWLEGAPNSQQTRSSFWGSCCELSSILFGILCGNEERERRKIFFIHLSIWAHIYTDIELFLNVNAHANWIEVRWMSTALKGLHGSKFDLLQKVLTNFFALSLGLGWVASLL